MIPARRPARAATATNSARRPAIAARITAEPAAAADAALSRASLPNGNDDARCRWGAKASGEPALEACCEIARPRIATFLRRKPRSMGGLGHAFAQRQFSKRPFAGPFAQRQFQEHACVGSFAQRQFQKRALVGVFARRFSSLRAAKTAFVRRHLAKIAVKSVFARRIARGLVVKTAFARRQPALEPLISPSCEGFVGKRASVPAASSAVFATCVALCPGVYRKGEVI